MSNSTLNTFRILGPFRGVAILGIVCFHILAGYREHYGDLLSFIIKHGSLGVSMFFVISGYGIASSISQMPIPKAEANTFIIRRLKRVYITYWFHLLFVAAILPVLSALVSMIKSGKFHIDFYNYSFVDWIEIVTLAKIFTSTSWRLNESFLPINGVVWFLGIIVQIYLVIYLSLFFNNKYKVINLILFVIALFSLNSDFKEYIPYGFFIPYFCPFYIGCVIFYCNSSDRCRLYSYLSLLTFVISVVIWFFSFSAFALSVAFGCVLYILYPYDAILINNRLVLMIGVLGTFSFSVYLLHVPLWPVVGMFTRNFIPISDMISVPLILIPIVFVVAYIWYLFFEKPSTLSAIVKELKHPLTTIKRGFFQFSIYEFEKK